MTASGTTTGTATTLARPRTLAAVCSPTIGWPVTSAVSAPSYGSNGLARDLGQPVHHNSIVRSDAKPAAAGRRGFGAKQAAPPRGVPR